MSWKRRCRYWESKSTVHKTKSAPERRRAFFEEFKSKTEYIKQYSSKKGIIFLGNGRHYSSGAELDDLMIDFQKKDYLAVFKENSKTFNYYRQLNIPVISLISGVCIGSGLELALFSHFRFALKNAIFALPEVSFQLIPGCGGIIRLVEIIGYQKTLEMTLTGETINTSEAMQFGLIDKIIPKANHLENIIDFANSIASAYEKDRKNQYIVKYYK